MESSHQTINISPDIAHFPSHIAQSGLAVAQISGSLNFCGDFGKGAMPTGYAEAQALYG